MAKTKTTEKTEKNWKNPYLAGRFYGKIYIFFCDFSVFFCFRYYKKMQKLIKPKKELKKLENPVFGRQIYPMEKYSFFSFFSFFVFFSSFSSCFGFGY